MNLSHANRLKNVNKIHCLQPKKSWNSKKKEDCLASDSDLKDSACDLKKNVAYKIYEVVESCESFERILLKLQIDMQCRWKKETLIIPLWKYINKLYLITNVQPFLVYEFKWMCLSSKHIIENRGNLIVKKKTKLFLETSGFR